MKKVITIIIVVVIILSVGIISYADTMTLPELPDNIYENYIIYKSVNDEIRLSTSNKLFEKGTVVLIDSYPINYKSYILTNNNWIIKTDVTNFNSEINCHTQEIYYSNRDILYKNSTNVFFSKTITPPYIFKNQFLLQPLRQSVTQNSQILLACGVGILSLILSVGLFRKLYQFL